MRKQEIDYILEKMLDSHENVSDLNITMGKPFQVESSGQLISVDMEPPVRSLTPFQTEIFALNLINQDRRLTEILLAQGSCDSSYELPGKARFRVNIFSQRGNYTCILRKLETRIPTLQDMNLPEAFKKMAEEKNGIILVTGATGSGKSTSLAALLDDINEKKSVHIVTLEDPVEFSHPHKMATFNQREMGNDFDTFSSGLRAALRQAPKVILVGEMRYRETVEIGLSAAETGHLVLSTLHTVDAGQTINRILGMFSTEEETQIRIRLADTVRWIVC
jgi:twitching motility protein PilT